jgi:hypothetical protein
MHTALSAQTFFHKPLVVLKAVLQNRQPAINIVTTGCAFLSGTKVLLL